jgi:hypothetical protein
VTGKAMITYYERIILVTSAFITVHFLLSQTVGKMIHNNEIGQIVMPPSDYTYYKHTKTIDVEKMSVTRGKQFRNYSGWEQLTRV